MIKRWAFNLLLSLDQLGNSLTGGFPDETISSRAARAKRDGKRWGCYLCRFLNSVEQDHCEDALESEKKHLQQPEELR